MDVEAAQKAIEPVILAEIGSEGIVQGWWTIVAWEDLDGDHRIGFVCGDHIPVSSSIGALTMVLDDMRKAASSEGIA